MIARPLCLLVAFIVTLCPLPALAQGFAGMGTDADGFDVPERGYRFDFPTDHGPHPTYRIEWWYLTATLTGADGRDYGIQWTLFRSALRPETRTGWNSPQLWLGHAGLTTPDRRFVAARFARDGIGQAGVPTAPFRAFIDNWHMNGLDASGIDTLDLSASGPDFAYDLRLSADTPLVLLLLATGLQGRGRAPTARRPDASHRRSLA